MNLCERLSQEDKHQLWRYLDAYNGSSSIFPEEKLPEFLRYWEPAKTAFYRMFGENFIIKKEVVFDKPIEELDDEMESQVRYGAQLVQRFIRAFSNKIEALFDVYNEAYCLRLFVEDSRMLVENQYNGQSFTIPASMTVNGRPLQVNSGCKVVKMVGKIAEALDIKVTARACSHCGTIDIEGDKCPWCGKKVEDHDGYEAFRRAHSLVLNQKKVRGNLCLSIHPLDFITMSDNDCGWQSCMQWMDAEGDYRLGTIEMMNSASVIVAYLEAREPMTLFGKPWSNKRWRQLYVVTPEMILGNRQYPYDHDLLQGTAINWLRDLCSAAVGWGPYANETCYVRNNSTNIFHGVSRVRVDISTCYMYNDIYDNRLAYVKQDWEENDYFELNISGPAICTGCTDIIEYDTVEPNRVVCRACDGSWRCDWCGDWHSEYDSPYYVGDNCYCDWCYHNELETCEVCKDQACDLTHVYIQVMDTNNADIIRDFNYNYYVGMCECCLNDPESYEEHYGPMFDTTNMWGSRIRAFDVKNITDTGLENGDLSDDVIEFIKSMREADGDEARLALIREFSY